MSISQLHAALLFVVFLSLCDDGLCASNGDEGLIGTSAIAQLESVPTTALDSPWLAGGDQDWPDTPAQYSLPVAEEPIPPAAAPSDSPHLWSAHELHEEFRRFSELQDEESDEKLEAADSKIKSLEQSLEDLISKGDKKVFPNVTINGVFQTDVGWFHQDEKSLAQFGRIQDGADFRRARLSAKGSVAEFTSYNLQMDFGFFGRPTFTDVWVEQTNVPILGTVRIGQWKQPFSLEAVSSFRYTTFMERSSLFQPFVPFRHIGVGFYDHSDEEDVTYAASVFRSGQDQFGGSISTDGGWGTAERITYLPYWECQGESYLHLGAGHFFNSPPRDRVNFRTIPEFFIGANANGLVGTSGQPVPGAQDGTPFFVSTGNLNVSCYNVLGSEVLWVEGPLSFQSESMINFVDSQTGGSNTILMGTYAQLGWFLTGEHRPYDRKAGAIDRIKPKKNFFFRDKNCDQGGGAWELATRFSYLDLDDGIAAGGTLTNYTAGVNWYWNPYTKVVFNYIHSLPDSPTLGRSTTDMFGLRAQVDF